jgi:hypothetical protein
LRYFKIVFNKKIPIIIPLHLYVVWRLWLADMNKAFQKESDALCRQENFARHLEEAGVESTAVGQNVAKPYSTLVTNLFEFVNWWWSYSASSAMHSPYIIRCSTSRCNAIKT